MPQILAITGPIYFIIALGFAATRFGLVLHPLAVLLGAMPMMGIYPILAQAYGHEGISAAALLVATVVSFLR